MPRNVEIDYLKFFAAFLVVILHGIEPGEGIQEYIYLIGSYGIPLFLMVNGYLLCDKKIDFHFVRNRIVRYASFCGLWIIILSVAMVVVKKKIILFPLITGIFSGKNLLFHFWFLVALVLIYCLFAFANFLLKPTEKNVSNIVCGTKWTPVLVIVAMTGLVVINFFLKMQIGKEIREIVLPSFRIITNGGYFVLGMYLKKNQVRNFVPCPFGATIFVIIATFLLFVISKLTGSVWASSMYITLPVIISTLIIFMCALSQSKEKKRLDMLDNIVSSSTAIWILHPFVLKVLNSCINAFFEQIPILIRIGSVIITIIACVLMDKMIRNIPLLNKLIQP